jgi:DNA invertase Pin-like site-specific DNA recombinase
MLNGTRVICLYRVSTLGQVEKDDIPMQKQYCREFAASKGWTIIKEYSEKGVSGYKVSAKERDAIQEIQKETLAGTFDILLVFMFDRLGRRDDETPFVVEWFAKNGIEVWSAQEGQQRFDTHVDKLMNYIRYWQASGESLKTSVRVTTRLSQMTEEGLYTGGSVPYGYRLAQNGRINKKGKAVYDLEIEPTEAEIVRLVFDMYVNEGYGAQRLSKYLYAKGILGRKGNNIPNTSINRMLKNIIYTGVMKNGNARSEPLEHLRIIPDELFQRAQTIMESRTMKRSDVPLNCAGQALLVGRVYCGHCGNRLTLTTSGKNIYRKDGSLYQKVRVRYQCHHKVRHPGDCDGQSGYGQTKLDAIVDEVVRIQLAKVKTVSRAELVGQRYQKDLSLAEALRMSAQKQLSALQREMTDLRAETLKVIRGTSKLSADLLNSLIDETSEKIKEAERQVVTAQAKYDEVHASAASYEAEYDQLLSWADLYASASIGKKKMIVAQLIKSIHVRRDYEISIEFNLSLEDLQNYTYAEKATP